MASYYGESEAAVDDKGRILVPQQLRQIMKVNGHETWFLTRGFDRAIFCLHLPMWERLQEQIPRNTLLPGQIDFWRVFLGGASRVSLDGQGRLMLPPSLRQFAGIDRNAVVIGVHDHLEIWSTEGWSRFQEQQLSAYKMMAADIFGGIRPAAAQTAEGTDGVSD